VRVLMLSWEYPPNVMGGMGAHVAGLAPALVRAGLEVHVIAPQPARPLASTAVTTDADGSNLEVTADGVIVHRVPMAADQVDVYKQAQSTNQAMQACGQALFASDQRFDLVHAHDWLVAFAAQALKHQFRLPLIATIHATERGRARGASLNTDLQRSIHGTEWWLAYEAWRVITCSHHMATEVQAFFRTPQEKIDIVPNGINPYYDAQWTQLELAECVARYAAQERKIVFTVGRLVHEKGFHLLIEAIPYILSEFPSTQFVIAGRGVEAEHLIHQAKRLGIDDHVQFPGFISDEERDCLYHVAACAVFPSLYEPFGVVALEAMTAGCPVVVTDTGGLREVVRHSKTGLTVYPDDVQSLAWGVLHLLRNPEMAVARAKEAQQVVNREFNWDVIADRTISVYHRVLYERQQIDW
jgi:glycogen(starch) synthase